MPGWGQWYKSRVYEVSRWVWDFRQVPACSCTSEAVVTEERDEPQLLVLPAPIWGR